MDEVLQSYLERREYENALRRLPKENSLVDFSSNDYLGLARNSNVQLSGKHGSGGSRLISGNRPKTEALERELALFYQTPTALLFNSGYDANLGLFSCLLRKGDTYIYDQLAHASIRDGIRLSHAKAYSFAHNNLQDLEKKLQKAEGQTVVVVESVYSMDGDMARLTEIIDICEQHDAALVVDEAHSTGIYGTYGQGLCCDLGLEQRIYARIHTFGKAAGAHGAVVVGSETLTNYLINFARSFIYTTALPEQSVQAIQNAHVALRNAALAREMLKRNIGFFQERIPEDIKKRWIPSSSPIQCLLVPDNSAVKTLAMKLQEVGFDLRPIMSPTVPKGKERLRICLHAYNTEKEITDLIKMVEKHAPYE